MWGWKCTQKQRHSLESIEQLVREIRQQFPHRGTEAIRRDPRQQFYFHVLRTRISSLKNHVVYISPQALRPYCRRESLQEYIMFTTLYKTVCSAGCRLNLMHRFVAGIIMLPARTKTRFFLTAFLQLFMIIFRLAAKTML
ncbi:hypothetical protein K503DRAFT_152377 [Rhizopogon vinicolor AM-OR11-026]|uniref:Uncharacterized protein n=1 Tax=Rhizopogon vinicolor AM-OR11-026 TaxID=1314800 RepID=A0A1B7N125_9AGAM|nr:hypothetical protein K503DRAFT_152377 [Rhizopogon vinicolor AM-OR11-026]